MVCPCPPPPHRDIKSRYYKLEGSLRNNWASVHEVATDLGKLSDDAGELESIIALAKSQQDEVRRQPDLKEAEHYAVHEWRATTISRSPRVSSEMSSQVVVPEYSLKASSANEKPRAEGEPRTKQWKMQNRDHVREPVSPICLEEKAGQRWKYLFGSSQVAVAPPGGKVTALSGSTKGSKSLFSCSRAWQGLKRGDGFAVSTRASNPGPMSSITLPAEADKRAARMLSIGKH